MTILFKRQFHQALREGAITQTFRDWKQPKVTVGKTYKVHGVGALHVKAVDPVRVSSITAAEARKAGFASRSDLLEALTPRARSAPAASHGVYRIRFELRDESHLPAAPSTGKPSGSELRDLLEKLAKTDGRSRRGPWVGRTLALIARHPKVAASELASQMDFERAPFKANVRKLKGLGLTRSHETGYELTPKGRAVHAAWPGD